MALKKSDQRALIILGVVLIGVVIYMLVFSKGKKDTSPPKIEPENVNSAVQTASLSPNLSIGSTSKSELLHFESWGRDPFSIEPTGSGEAGNKSRPQLKGIFWIQDKPFVLINDLILSEGEEAGGVRVGRINEEEVLCYQGSQSFTLRWRESP